MQLKMKNNSLIFALIQCSATALHLMSEEWIITEPEPWENIIPEPADAPSGNGLA